MKVLFDSQIFDFQKYGGISIYFFQLMEEFQRRDIDFKFATERTFNENLLNFPEILNEDQSKIFGFRKFQYERIKKINKQYLRKEYCANRELIYHSTFYFDYLKEIPKKHPEVITIHDMIHEEFPKYFSNASKIIKLKKQKIEKCQHIICVSNYTKERLLSIYPEIPEQKLSVIHHGVYHTSISKKNANKVILYIGNRVQYKGFFEMVKDIESWLKDNPEWQLWCWGGGNFSVTEKKLFKKLELTKQIVLISPSQKSKIEVLSEAGLLILPSFVEGFGIPLIEALQSDCPVLVKDIPVFREIGKDFAIFFSDKKSLLNGLEVISKRDNNFLLNRFKELKKYYSLERMVDQTLNVYSRVRCT